MRNPIRPLSLPLAACAAVLALSAQAASPPAAERMAPLAEGSLMTYHRSSSGSFGSFDGPVTWTLGSSAWQGRPVAASTSAVGTSLYEPGTLALLAILDAKGAPVASYDPPIDYRWPMQVGNSWQSRHTMTVHATGRAIVLDFDWKVEAWEEIKVPAGTFQAYRVSWTNSLGETETRWTAPATGVDVVKRHVERSAAHPQGPGVLDAELLARRMPGHP